MKGYLRKPWASAVLCETCGLSHGAWQGSERTLAGSRLWYPGFSMSCELRAIYDSLAAYPLGNSFFDLLKKYSTEFQGNCYPIPVPLSYTHK